MLNSKQLAWYRKGLVILPEKYWYAYCGIKLSKCLMMQDQEFWVYEYKELSLQYQCEHNTCLTIRQLLNLTHSTAQLTAACCEWISIFKSIIWDQLRSNFDKKKTSLYSLYDCQLLHCYLKLLQKHNLGHKVQHFPRYFLLFRWTSFTWNIKTCLPFQEFLRPAQTSFLLLRKLNLLIEPST